MMWSSDKKWEKDEVPLALELPGHRSSTIELE